MPAADRKVSRTHHAAHHLTPAELQELHDLAAQWGTEIMPRRTGDDAIEFDLSALEWHRPGPPPPGWSKAP